MVSSVGSLEVGENHPSERFGTCVRVIGERGARPRSLVFLHQLRLNSAVSDLSDLQNSLPYR